MQTPVPFLAVVLTVVLLVTFSTPAPAEADVLTALAIAAVAVGAIIIIAYLIVANVSDARRAGAEPVVWVVQASQAP